MALDKTLYGRFTVPENPLSVNDLYEQIYVLYLRLHTAQKLLEIPEIGKSHLKSIEYDLEKLLCLQGE